jgi:hypothetical protein
MYTIDTAIAVSTNGGNQSPGGASPYAAPMRVNEWATVNEVAVATTSLRRRSGMTRHSRNSR